MKQYGHSTVKKQQVFCPISGFLCCSVYFYFKNIKGICTNLSGFQFIVLLVLCVRGFKMTACITFTICFVFKQWTGYVSSRFVYILYKKRPMEVVGRLHQRLCFVPSHFQLIKSIGYSNISDTSLLNLDRLCHSKAHSQCTIERDCSYDY